MRGIAIVVLCAPWIFGTSVARAVQFDFTESGSWALTPTAIQRCDVLVTPLEGTTLRGPVWRSGGGIGVVGLGPLSEHVDGQESLRFDFPAAATRIGLAIANATDEDQDEDFARLEAFAPGGASLGSLLVTTLGDVNVSAAFVDQPIAAVRIYAEGDTFRVGRVEYDPAPGSVVTSPLDTITTISQAFNEFDQCGVRVEAPGTTIAFHPDGSGPDAGGVGVFGGFRSNTLDGSETIAFHVPVGASQIEFDAALFLDLDSDMMTGEALLEAFDRNDQSLGTVSLIEESTVALVDFYGSTEIGHFTVTAQNDAQRIERVRYVPEPPARSAAVVAAGACGVLAMRRGGRRRARPRAAHLHPRRIG